MHTTIFRRCAVGAAVLIMLAGCTGMGGHSVRYSNEVMTNEAGMTLYVFDKDVPGSGKSVCVAQCAKNWPPFTAAQNDREAGDWTVITREDGVRQWAYAGKPLYFWSKDQKAGDKTGDGVNNAWHVVKVPFSTPLSR